MLHALLFLLQPQVSCSVVTPDTTVDVYPGDCGPSHVAGQCSVRAAVATTPCAVLLDPALGAFQLTIAPSGAEDNSSGDLNPFDALSIRSTVPGTRAILTTAVDARVVRSAFILNLVDLEVSYGSAPTGYGGCVLAPAANFTHVAVHHCHAPEGGGGVYIGPNAMSSHGSLFDANSAGMHGGGVYAQALVSENDTFSNNTAASGYGGGLFFDTGTLTQDEFGGNHAVNGLGGGVYIQGQLLSGQGLHAHGNEAANGGGAYVNSNMGASTIGASSFINNSAHLTTALPDSGYGGGIACGVSPRLFVSGSRVLGNHAADDGGGIYCDGMLRLSNSDIGDNSADGAGGGIAFVQTSGPDMDMLVSGSTIHGNSAVESGGGVHVQLFESAYAARNLIVNSTISGNTGGGVAEESITVGSPLVILASTIADNSGPGLQSISWVTVGGSIIANNTDACAASAQTFSLGYNIASDASCAFLTATGDTQSTDPLLGALAYHGGGVLTHELLAGSPAIDAGNTATCPGPYDGRGAARMQGSSCDVGAYEATASALTLTLDATTPAAPQAGGTVTYQLTVSNQADAPAQGVRLTLVLPAGFTLTSANCAQSGADLSCDVGDLLPGDSASVVLVFAIARDATSFGATVSVDAVTPIVTPAPLALSTSIAPAVADVAVAMAHVPSAPRADEQMAYLLDVSNVGPGVAFATTLTQTLPEGVQVIAPAGCAQSGATLSCSLGDVPAGEHRLLYVALATAVEESTSASVTTASNDPNTSNNSAADMLAFSVASSAAVSAKAGCGCSDNGGAGLLAALLLCVFALRRTRAVARR